jgi:hypothetical protein
MPQGPAQLQSPQLTTPPVGQSPAIVEDSEYLDDNTTDDFSEGSPDTEDDEMDSYGIEELRRMFAGLLTYMDHLPSTWSTAFKHYRQVDLTLDIAKAHGLVVDFGRHSVVRPRDHNRDLLSIGQLVEELDIDKWMTFKNKLTLYFRVHELLNACEFSMGHGSSDMWSDELDNCYHLVRHWEQEPSGDEWWTKGRFGGDETRVRLGNLVDVRYTLCRDIDLLTPGPLTLQEITALVK